MKNLLLALLIIAGFAACKSDPQFSTENRNIRLLSDSGSYANNVLSDTNSTMKTEVAPAAVAEKPRTIVKTIVIEKAAPKEKNISPVAASTVDAKPVSTVSTPPVVTAPTIDSTSTVGTNSGAGNSSKTASTSSEKVEKKTGMKKATQGAIIGGVAGAVGGAVVSKKKGLGAVIGGIAGAAGGYIIGNKMDKKSNQYMIE
jgi:hypothetical protein